MRIHAAWFLLLLFATGGALLWAQSSGVSAAGGKTGGAAAPTHFDVISVRPNNSGSGNWGVDDNGGNITAQNVSLVQLLTSALNMQEELVSGLPGWASSAHFDIQAKVLDADPKVMKHMTDEQDRALLLSILEDRFGFKAHFETRMLPVYDLEVARGGLLTKPAPRAAAEEGVESDPNAGGIEIHNNTMTVTRGTMDRIAQSLTREVQRTVVDKTGLAGQYSFTIRFTPERQLTGPDTGLPDAPPSIFVALEQQLGLKLVADKGPVRTLLVDHVEQPTEN